MHIDNCTGCKKAFDAPLAPCPDSIVGCLVAHYGKMSFVCPHCGADNAAEVSRAMREGPHYEEIGLAVFNPRALMRLQLHPGPNDKPRDDPQLDLFRNG